MVLDAREQHTHGIGAVVQVGDTSTVQVTGQFVDVRLKLCKSYGAGNESRGGSGRGLKGGSEGRSGGLKGGSRTSQGVG